LLQMICRRPNIFEDVASDLLLKIKPGLGIAINMPYLNTKKWGFQSPTVLCMRRSGMSIESITSGAGISNEGPRANAVAAGGSRHQGGVRQARLG